MARQLARCADRSFVTEQAARSGDGRAVGAQVHPLKPQLLSEGRIIFDQNGERLTVGGLQECACRIPANFIGGAGIKAAAGRASRKRD